MRLRNLFNSKKKIVIWVLILCVIIIGGSLGGYEYYSIQQQKKVEAQHKAYADKFNKTTLDIIGQTLLCEAMIDETSQTWHNAIYNTSFGDFNIALSNLHQKYTDNGALSDRETAKNNIEKEMISLQNPPDDYKPTYNLFVELYSKYGQIYSQATSPSGSLQTYGQDTESKASDFNEILDKIKVLKPEAVKQK